MNPNNKFSVKLSWSFYDWANSAWSAIIITFIFSRYFVDVLAPNENIGTLYWTWTIGISSLVAAFVSPFFGSISDQSQKSKNWLIFTTLIYSLISISFWMAVPGQINLMFIIIFIFIGNISYEISQIFYNGQLKLISDKDNYAKLSGLAWGLGYAGTVIIFIIYFVLFFVPQEPLFNLDKNTYENIRISFPITGLWIIIFSLPLFITFKDPTKRNLNSWIEMFNSVHNTQKALAGNANAQLFFENMLIDFCEAA